MITGFQLQPSQPGTPAFLRRLFIIAVALAGIVPGVSTLNAQTTIIRKVIGSGGGTTESSGHTIQGTLSQTAVGRLARRDNQRHDVGFWYKAYRADVVTRVTIPDLQAEPGTRLTVPVYLTVSETERPFLPRQFRMRIRYNHTLLFPGDNTPACTFSGDTCMLEINGTAEEGDSVIAELGFTATLGNAENTELTIEEFEWQQMAEERIVVTKDHGLFALLGVCREGGEIRLIHSSGFASRIRLWPNPAAGRTTLEFVSAEQGPVDVRLVDMLGNEVASLAETEVEAERLYRTEVDLSRIPSGSYMVVYTTPTGRQTQRLLITQ